MANLFGRTIAGLARRKTEQLWMHPQSVQLALPQPILRQLSVSVNNDFRLRSHRQPTGNSTKFSWPTSLEGSRVLPSRFYASKNIKKDKKTKTIVDIPLEELEGVVHFAEYETSLKNLVEEFREQLSKQFSLRTNSASFDSITVELDDKKHPLNNIAQITFKTPQLIMINLAATPNYVQPVIKALEASGMNLSPQVEGHVIYLAVPKVSRDHREVLAKNAGAACNKFKDRVRAIQNTYIREVKSKEDKISKDLVHNAVAKLMEIAEAQGKYMETLLISKQNDLLMA